MVTAQCEGWSEGSGSGARLARCAHIRVYFGAEIAAGEPKADVNSIPDKAFVRSDNCLNDFNHEAICGDSCGHEER